MGHKHKVSKRVGAAAGCISKAEMLLFSNLQAAVRALQTQDISWHNLPRRVTSHTRRARARRARLLMWATVGGGSVASLEPHSSG